VIEVLVKQFFVVVQPWYDSNCAHQERNAHGLPLPVSISVELVISNLPLKKDTLASAPPETIGITNPLHYSLLSETDDSCFRSILYAPITARTLNNTTTTSAHRAVLGQSQTTIVLR